MKTILTLMLSIIISISQVIGQEIPLKISFQGKLLDNGSPVTGYKNITFTIGSWVETHYNVPVNDGLYSVKLGEISPIPINIFDYSSDVKMVISVDGINLLPQTDILSSPYAFKAEKSVDAEKIAGRTVSTTSPNQDQVLKWNGSSWAPGIDLSGGTYSAGSGININGSTISALTSDAIWNSNKLQGRSVSNSSPSNGEVLKWNGNSWMPDTDNTGSGGSNINGTTNYLIKFTGSTSGGNSQLFDNGSNVGIGTTSPEYKFHVTANVSTDNRGVGHFINTATNVDAAGIYGECKSTAYWGYGGVFQGGYVGVRGEVLQYGNSSNTYVGVSGYAEEIDASLQTPLIGVFGKTNGGDPLNRYALYGLGNFAVTGTKAFIIDHPRYPKEKYLKHYCMESPEVLNSYRGNAILDANGEAVITLPDYYELININFSYHLTPIGNPTVLYIKEEIKENKFTIAGGTKNMKVSWLVISERNDLELQQRPEIKQVEIEKPKNSKGKYLIPELFGAPKEMGIFYKADIRCNKKNEEN